MDEKLYFHLLPPELNRYIAKYVPDPPCLEVQEIVAGEFLELDPAQPYKFNPPEEKPVDDVEYELMVENFIEETPVYYAINRGELVKMQLKIYMRELEKCIPDVLEFKRHIEDFKYKGYAWIEMHGDSLYSFTKENDVIGVQTAETHIQQFKWHKYVDVFTLMFQDMASRVEAMRVARRREAVWW